MALARTTIIITIRVVQRQTQVHHWLASVPSD
jgi:hypothetical protein